MVVGLVLQLLPQWYGLRQVEGVDGSEPREVSGATQSDSDRVSQAGFSPGLEIFRLRSERAKGSLEEGSSSHENSSDISVVPDFTPTLSIYDVPGGAGRALVSGLTNPGFRAGVPAFLHILSLLPNLAQLPINADQVGASLH